MHNVNMTLAVTIAALNRSESIETSDLPDASIEFLLNYGAKQLLNDSHVSGESAAEKAALVDKKLKKLYDGTLSIRDSNRGDALATEIKRLARKLAGDWFRKNGIKDKDIAEADWKEKVNEYAGKAKVIETAKANVAAAEALADIDEE
jgi:hypothetical protein